MKDRIGEIRENTNGTKMKIIKYIRSDNMYVEFQDSFKYIVKCQYKEFKLGKVKNPYDPDSTLTDAERKWLKAFLWTINKLFIFC